MIIYLSLYKVYLDIALERYADLCQEMSNKSNQLWNNISSMDLESTNNHLNKITSEA